jgi:hypothetical protein
VKIYTELNPFAQEGTNTFELLLTPADWDVMSEFAAILFMKGLFARTNSDYLGQFDFARESVQCSRSHRLIENLPNTRHFP